MKNEFFKRLVSSIILLPLIFLIIIYGSYYFILLLIICFFLSCYEWHLMSFKKPYYLIGLIYLMLSFITVYKIRTDINGEYIFFLFIISICILTDIGGYIFGRILKGRKLTKYSPNKTYAGVLGGYFFSLFSILLLYFFKITNPSILTNMFLFIILISTISQIGDILISYFKRISKIKDTGKIIPGHGGLLDRIDGMIFAFPFAYLIMFNDFFNKF